MVFEGIVISPEHSLNSEIKRNKNMTQILIEVDDALLSAALIESQEQQITLDTFINEAIKTILADPNSPAPKPISIDTILKNTVECAKKTPQGHEFLLVDICTDDDWNALSSGERKSLGKGFRKAVETASPQIAEHVRRTNSNKAVYRRL